jgi:nickel-dependent lactate racemase
VHIQLSSGNGELLALQVPAEKLIAPCATPQPTNLDVAESLAQAVSAPLGYPPLQQAILPGDHVTIAVDRELPQIELVINELLRQLTAAGNEPENITVLVASQQQCELLAGSWPSAWTAAIGLHVHDPNGETSLAYLAATHDGRPLYLNRAIDDADVFLPVGVQRLDDRGVHSSWFPTYSNLETQSRHQSPGNIEWQTHQRRRRKETEEAGWLLGVRLIVQVLPGPAGSIAGIWCGDAEAVAEAAGRAGQALWTQEVDRPADLVIAVLDADPREQSWRQVAQALATASQAVNDGGAIVLWTELGVEPGPALRSLASIDESDDEQRLALLKQRSADATAAKLISDSLERCRVYLHSQLDDALVEEIGLATLHDAAELQRLVDRAATCLVIGSAQHAGIRLKQPVEA